MNAEKTTEILEQLRFEQQNGLYIDEPVIKALDDAIASVKALNEIKLNISRLENISHSTGNVNVMLFMTDLKRIISEVTIGEKNCE